MFLDFEPAVSVCFLVTIDSPEHSLGRFYSCEGLGCEMVLEQREEGGTNDFTWQLPSRLKYSNIKLSRPVGPDTAMIAAWFQRMNVTYAPTTAVIAALSLTMGPVAVWSIGGVVPVRWTGPSLSLESPKVATETLELAHTGFLSPGLLVS